MNPSTDTHFAQDLLSYGRQELLVKMRFMALPFSKLKPSPDIVGTLVGDKGEVLHYDGDALIMDFAKEKTSPQGSTYTWSFTVSFAIFFQKKRRKVVVSRL